MGTRSFIGKRHADGHVTGIYCHWDGYPSHNGRILRDHYTTEDQMDALLALGSLSVLGENIGKRHDFNTHDSTKGRTKGWCLAYGRDRGETDVAAQTFENVEAFCTAARESWAEWAYIFDPERGKWATTALLEDRRIWQDITDAINTEMAAAV